MKKGTTDATGGQRHDWQVPRDVAIPRLVDAHGGRLYGLGLRLCGSPEGAEDLVQEVFLAAYRKWDQFEGRSNPITWLYTIATHACQRLQRKRAGEPARMESLEELLPFGAATMAVEPAGGLNEALHREAVGRVGEAIVQLPEDFRMPLVLKDILGFPVAEVAQVLGIKEATAKTRLHRARLKIRHALEDALPKREVPPPAYDRQVCLDLLKAKQESLDRGVAMAGIDEVVCERCQELFRTMDLGLDLCREIGVGTLPEDVRRRLLESAREDPRRHL